MKVKNIMITAIGILVAAVTLALFFIVGIGGQKSVLDYIALGMILFSELLFLGGMFFIFNAGDTGKASFARIGIGITMFLYWGFVTIPSIFYSSFLDNSLVSYLVYQIILFTVMAIVSIILSYFILNQENK